MATAYGGATEPAPAASILYKISLPLILSIISQ